VALGSCPIYGTREKLVLSLPQLTTERVIRSDGNFTLDDVYPATKGPWVDKNIYNVEPAELGFYCLYKAADAAAMNKTVPPTPYFPPTIPDCVNTEQVAARHASMLIGAGFDYVALDVTNWPQVNHATDLAILRPLAVLADEWLALRAAGHPTPFMAPWVNSHTAAYANGHVTSWQWFLDHVYNNATRQPLLWRRPDQPEVLNADGTVAPLKMAFFVPDNQFYNETVNGMIEFNGGRKNIEVIRMWALQSKKSFDTGSWSFFSGCTTPAGALTTSMVGAGPCNQVGSIHLYIYIGIN
jgi:hypothetical protein